MSFLEFNVSGEPGYVTIDKPSEALNPSDSMTVEALFVLLGDSEDATIFSLPASEKWEAPYVAWRLGFHGRGGLPEFQVTIEGDTGPTTVCAQSPVPHHQLAHIAGRYDGRFVELYVNGELVAQTENAGRIIQSMQKPTMGARSSTGWAGSSSVV